MQADPEELQRLAQLYSAMTDTELENIANDPDSLTDAAQNAIAVELERRHLQIDPAPPEGHDQAEYRNLVTIRKYRDLPEALLAKGSLESAGIACQLVDDNMVRMFVSTFTGGVRLQVMQEDVAAAEEILDLPMSATFDPADSVESWQPRCPACYSPDVTFEDRSKPLAPTSAYAEQPYQLHIRVGRCHACGREWEDS